MNAMINGILNFLEFVNNHWTEIIVIVGLIFAIYKKTKKFLATSTDSKITVAKSQIKEIMLKLVTDAERNYQELSKAGAMKKSYVIEKLFSKYPIFAKVTNQEELMAWINETIDESLETMKDVFSENNDQTESA